jgi:hypothetical protein
LPTPPLALITSVVFIVIWLRPCASKIDRVR